ncbi:MAG: VWA domain-containing protein [Myxococcaceae bacterium]|nr:VWA domain-containing protein [Myxococcaceae bacterium]
MEHISRHALALASLALVACGGAPLTAGPRCLSLNAPEGVDPLAVSLPARVSLFFSVDTCDGAPVAGLTADAFEVQEDGKPLSALESQRAVRPKGQRSRLSSLLLLDLSGSVLRAGDFPALKEAARRYVSRVLGPRDDGQRLAIYTFDGREEPQLLVDFTGDVAAAQRGLDSLDAVECSTNAQCAGFTDRRTCAGWRCVDDSTNLNGAVVHAVERLERALEAEPLVAWKEGALVVITDGTDQAARVSTFDMLERTARTTVRRFTVGLGSEVDPKVLAALGRDGTWPVARANGLSDAFDQVAARVTARANRFYLLEYCSPRRSGQHTVKVVARAPGEGAETLVGGLSRTFDATGFTSGCEL